jgi:hypothetical protein
VTVKSKDTIGDGLKITRRTLRLVRLVLIAATAGATLWLVLLNRRLYKPGRVETAIAQLRFLEKSLADGEAERMQSIFPEGYVFSWALYGLASAQVARALPPSDERRDKALREARTAVAHVASDHAKGSFVLDMEPKYGAFYSSWALYLRSSVLRASGSQGPVPFDLSEYERDCDSFAAALSKTESPYLPSYPGAVWPADIGPGVAALAIADSVFGGRYRSIIARWVEAVRQQVDPEYGAIPHVANGGPRGESLALLSYILVEVDPSLARQQYDILRENFVSYTWGVPGVREYPHGEDGPGDIDSGPIVLGFSGPATVVGAGAAIANGDEDLATALLATAEVAGFPIEIAGRRRYAGGYLPVGDAFLAWARSALPAAPRAPYPPLVPWWWRLPVHALSLAVGFSALYLAIRANRFAVQHLHAAVPLEQRRIERRG